MRVIANVGDVGQRMVVRMSDGGQLPMRVRMPMVFHARVMYVTYVVVGM